MSEVNHLAVRWVAPSELLDDECRSSSAAAFVGDSWRKSTKRPVHELRKLVREHVCVIGIATPVGEPDTFLGWAAVVPSRNAIVHVYVKNAFRAPKEGPSEFRVGSSLAILCGIKFDRPVPCLTWSKAAARIAARPGNPYRLVPPRGVALTDVNYPQLGKVFGWTAAELKAKAQALFIEALVLTTRAPQVSCDHSEAKFVRGDLVHCQCGQAFKVPCHCIRLQQLLPRVFQCVDCGKTFGQGKAA